MTKHNNEINEGPDQNDADLLDENSVKMIYCSNCGAQISEHAQQCHHCKHWITTKPTTGMFTGKSLWWIILAILGIAMFILLYAF